MNEMRVLRNLCRGSLSHPETQWEADSRIGIRGARCPAELCSGTLRATTPASHGCGLKFGRWFAKECLLIMYIVIIYIHSLPLRLSREYLEGLFGRCADQNAPGVSLFAPGEWRYASV